MQTKAQSIEEPARAVSKFSDYAQFMKFRLASLVVFSAVIGYFMGIREFSRSADWVEIIMLILGGFLVTGSSNGFNQIIERETDKLMTRTANRPIPTGRMSVTEGMIAASITGAAGIFLLWYYLNPLSGLLSAISLLLYVVLYTPMKRVSPLAVFVGAFPGAIPAMLGWVAADPGFGSIGVTALILFAVQFVWQFPHFWAIAWVADDDYRKAGFRLLPSAGGRDKSTAFQILVYTLFLMPLSVMPLVLPIYSDSKLISTGTIGVLIAVISGVFFAAQAFKLYRTLDTKDASRVMFGSFIYLPVVQLALLFG
ncbi:MAG: heme o synthase [Bacteroidia bacterium]|nr:heme o synthase [Bacteroidia bacterium]